MRELLYQSMIGDVFYQNNVAHQLTIAEENHAFKRINDESTCSILRIV